MGLQFDRVIVANGSAGTQAGLVAGFALLHRHALVHGYSVLADEAVALENTRAMSRGCAALLAGDDEVARERRHRGRRASRARLRPAHARSGRRRPLLASHEGLLLDPVYSAKAFAGLLGQARRGEFAREENILFRHDRRHACRCSRTASSCRVRRLRRLETRDENIHPRSPPPPWRSASGAPTAADISTSPYLLGDWGALRTRLADRGIASRLPNLSGRRFVQVGGLVHGLKRCRPVRRREP